MASISRKLWNDLTEREKEILKAIGIAPKKHKSPAQKSHAVKAPDPYVLKVTTYCHLCKEETVDYFNMVLSEVEGVPPHLHAIKVDGDQASRIAHAIGTTIVEKDRHTSVCCKCYTKLKDWNQEDLIIKLIKAQGKLAVGACR